MAMPNLTPVNKRRRLFEKFCAIFDAALGKQLKALKHLKMVLRVREKEKVYSSLRKFGTFPLTPRPESCEMWKLREVIRESFFVVRRLQDFVALESLKLEASKEQTESVAAERNQFVTKSCPPIK